VLPAIVVDGAERMQRCQRAVYEACERVELGGLTCEEVTIEVGSKSMHGPRTHLHSAIRKPDGDGADLCVLPGAVFPAVDERQAGASRLGIRWRYATGPVGGGRG